MRDDLFLDRIEEIYMDNRQQLFTYALSITRNSCDAEDAVQLAFRNVLRAKRRPAELL